MLRAFVQELDCRQLNGSNLVREAEPTCIVAREHCHALSSTSPMGTAAPQQLVHHATVGKGVELVNSTGSLALAQPAA